MSHRPHRLWLPLALAVGTLALPGIACKPICELNPTAPECLPKVSPLPARLAWPPPNQLRLPIPAGWNPGLHKLQLDLVAPGAEAKLGACTATPPAPADMTTTISVPVRQQPDLRLPGPAQWVLRACELAAGSSPELQRALVSVYVPPKFRDPKLVTDASPGAGISVLEYNGVALGDMPGRIHVSQTILRTTTSHRLRPLDADGNAIYLANQDFLEAGPMWQVAVSRGGGLFSCLTGDASCRNTDQTLKVELAPFAPRTGKVPHWLAADSTLLVADAAGDRVAVLQGDRLWLHALAADNRSLVSLGSCALDSPDTQPLAIALATGRASPGQTVADPTDASTPPTAVTAVVLGLLKMQPRVVACREDRMGTGSTVGLDADTGACFTKALMKATETPAQIALADIDADGLLDLVAAPKSKDRNLFYVPGVIRGDDCGIVELPVKQPAEVLIGLAVGRTSHTRLDSSDMMSPILPDLAIAAKDSIHYFQRCGATCP